MRVFDRLREVIQGDAHDADSKALAKEWIQLLKESEEVAGLLNNKGFQIILKQLSSDFKARMRVKIAEDAELTAIRRMFIRTIGMSNTEESIEKILDEFEKETDVN